MKPTILFVHSNSELYGADFILLEVVRAVKEVVQPIVAIPGEGDLSRALIGEGVQTVYTRESLLRRVNFKPHKLPRFFWNVFRDARELVNLISEKHVELVYSNTGAVVTGAIAARICGIPNMYHVHEIIVNPRWFARAIARIILGNSMEVVAVSAAVREQLIKYMRPGDPPISIIHNGIDPSRFDTDDNMEEIRSELGAGPEQVLFGVIGRIHPWKGQKYFVEAARLVADVFPQARFVIVGGTFTGYEYLVEDLKNSMRELGLKDRMKVLPFRKDVPSIMRALDVFVLPSTLPDPLPTVVLESMAAHKPVIATAHGGALEMVIHGETGLLAPHQDVSGFAEAMLELSADKQKRVRFGQAGRERVEEEFSRSRFHNEIRSSILKHLTSNPLEQRASNLKSECTH